MNGEQLLEKLNWRYAVKKFDNTKKISSSDWITLEDSLILSPSSYGLQPWKFLIVQNSELRKKLTPISWKQSQVEDCSHYVVFCVKEKMTEADIAKYIDLITKVRGVQRDSLTGFEKAMLGDVVTGPRSKWVTEWATRQIYIALGSLMTCAAVLNIDTCPMEGFEPEKYDAVLDLKGSGYKAIVCLALGYRSNEDFLSKAKKVRYPKAQIIKTI